MELRTTREMRRNEQLSKALSKKGESTDAPAQAQPAQKPTRAAPSDKVSLSQQALAWLDEQSRKMWESVQEQQRRQNRMNDGLSALEGKKRELDALSKQLKVLEKCHKIAASIMKGDRVPLEDREYLMNNDPDGYKLAMAMRRTKKDPEDCESVLDDEDRNGAKRETGGVGEVPAVQSAEPSGGGEAPASSGGGED